VVWFGEESKVNSSAARDDGTLFLDVPDDLGEGTYDVFVTNANGKSKAARIVIE